ncbi:hypothetical protein P7C70_g6383, partial [Phenoliferia sp. Uapishka_3]
MHVDSKTVPKKLQEEFARSGVKISRWSAWKAKVHLAGESIEDQAEQFQKIPDYVEHIKAADPDAVTEVVLNTVTNTFESVFICPSANQTAWYNSRPFLAVDGAHTRAAHENLLLLAAAYDGEDELLIVAWAFVPKEKESTWTWFLRLLDRALGGDLNSIRVTILSDRQKGLLNAIREVMPNACEGFCCVHLLRNLTDNYKACKNSVEAFFWAAVKAPSKEQFVEAMQALADNCGVGPANYLNAISHKRWATYAFPGRRYGRKSSNIVEIANAALSAARSLAPLDLLSTIYEYEMVKFSERAAAGQARQDEFTAAATAVFLQEIDKSREYSVLLSVNRAPTWSGLVRHPLQKTQDYAVEIELSDPDDPDGQLVASCPCNMPKDTDIPCRHAIGLAAECGLVPRQLITWEYTTSAYQDAYSIPLPAISTTALEVDADILAPAKKRKRGRPQKVRMEKGVAAGKKIGGKGTRPCGLCRVPGHLRSKCPNKPPAEEEEEDSD